MTKISFHFFSFPSHFWNRHETTAYKISVLTKTPQLWKAKCLRLTKPPRMRTVYVTNEEKKEALFWTLSKCSAAGFIFHFGELVECPAREVEIPGSTPTNVILKFGERGFWKWPSFFQMRMGVAVVFNLAKILPRPKSATFWKGFSGIAFFVSTVWSFLTKSR